MLLPMNTLGILVKRRVKPQQFTSLGCAVEPGFEISSIQWNTGLLRNRLGCHAMRPKKIATKGTNETLVYMTIGFEIVSRKKTSLNQQQVYANINNFVYLEGKT